MPKTRRTKSRGPKSLRLEVRTRQLGSDLLGESGDVTGAAEKDKNDHDHDVDDHDVDDHDVDDHDDGCVTSLSPFSLLFPEQNSPLKQGFFSEYSLKHSQTAKNRCFKWNKDIFGDIFTSCLKHQFQDNEIVRNNIKTKLN